MSTTLYVLIALLTVAPDQTDSLIIDHNLSYEDCQRRLETGPVFTRPQLRRLQNITMICEPASE